MALPAIWGFVTDFGDSAVTAPLAALTLFFLLATGERRIALDWVLATGGCAVAIGALKLVFGACGQRLAIADIVSPSGHAAMSTAVYGCLALLIGARRAPLRRHAVNIIAALAIVGVALSRVALHDHTPAEIAVGLVVGAIAVAAFHAVGRRHPKPALPLGWLLLCGAVLVALMHGTRWMIEPEMRRLAWDFRLALPWCR